MLVFVLPLICNQCYTLGINNCLYLFENKPGESKKLTSSADCRIKSMCLMFKNEKFGSHFLGSVFNSPIELKFLSIRRSVITRDQISIGSDMVFLVLVIRLARWGKT